MKENGGKCLVMEEWSKRCDSYWAGCQEIRKSSSAGVMQLGSRTLDAKTRKQHIIVSCSAEAELCAAALGASDTKGMVWSFCDLGYEMKPVLSINAKATEHIFHRQGIGRLKHMDIAYLWMQDAVRSKRLRVRRVKK